MKAKFFLFSTLLFINTVVSIYAQTPKQVNSFPEDYIGKTIIFKNIAYWPILKEDNGYYSVCISISNSYGELSSWGFQRLDKIIGVVEKGIAKQMINQNLGGYADYYFGTVTGTVVKSKQVFGSDYLFIISKILTHHLNQEYNISQTFSK